MWNKEEILIIASPNIGGLSKIVDGTVEVFDRIDTTGISANDNLFVRALQHESHAVFHLQHRDGSRKKLVYNDIWDIHDVFLVKDHFYAVSTGSNEVVLISIKEGDIVHRWASPGENDSWHLNCLDQWNGRMVVSAFGHFNTHREYIGNSHQKGFIKNLESSDIFWGQLTQPHSHKRVDSRTYVCDSGTGRLLVLDEKNVIHAVSLNGYPRGLAVTSEYIAVGISTQRNLENNVYGSIKLLDKNSFIQEKEFFLPFREIYSIQIVNSQLSDLLKVARFS
ncbi:DUF4915 domain-containing protein [Cohnella sp.]|uniref:DUF4915 domain-containing protein n=1 Tax=Cohnella sp. TaxID=1883426 RepID=UPI00356527BF